MTLIDIRLYKLSQSVNLYDITHPVLVFQYFNVQKSVRCLHKMTIEQPCIDPGKIPQATAQEHKTVCATVYQGCILTLDVL